MSEDQGPASTLFALRRPERENRRQAGAKMMTNVRELRLNSRRSFSLLELGKDDTWWAR